MATIKKIKDTLSSIRSPLVFFAFSLFIVEAFFTLSMTINTPSPSECHQILVLVLSFLMFSLVVTYVFYLTWKTPKHLVLDQDGHLEDAIRSQAEEESYARQFHNSSDSVLELEHEADGDTELETVYKQLNNGNYRAAINKLSELTNEDDKYYKHLISAFVVSPAIEDWEKAEDYIYVYGEPAHFRKLAFNYWVRGDINKSISLSEIGLKKAKGINNEELIGSIKNSLAYYYADAGRKDKASIAYDFAKTEVDRRYETSKDEQEQEQEQKQELISYEDALDTLGFVKITFGQTREEILDGISLCTESLKLGGNKDLFRKHYDKATERIRSL